MDSPLTSSGRLSHQGLEPIVLRVLLRLRAWLPPDCQLALQLSHDNPRIRANASRLEEALLSACVVAHQSIHEISTVMVVEMTEVLLDDIVLDPDAQKLQGGLPPRRYVRIAVSNGSRIEVTPLHTLMPAGAGAGQEAVPAHRLKLTEIQAIVEQQGGSMTLAREPGRGVEFDFYLPTALPLQPLATNGSGTAIKQVMYVDDYEDMRALVGETLPDAGFRVTCHETARQALSALIANPHACDVLVCDYRLQGNSGLDLLRQVKLLRADLPVIIISGYVDAALQTRAREEGAAMVISKADDLSELCVALKELLGNEPHPALVTYSEWAKL